MNGAEIPYQLRPGKFVDRQMFVELLSRLLQARGPEKYIYVSMGGRHLVDHYAVYRELGIKALYSFDVDANGVARQKFNRPTDRTICTQMHSSALPGAIDAIAQKFPSKKNFIVWLDFTNTEWKQQLQEAEQTLLKMRHGDIFRITLNANISNLKKASPGNALDRAKLRADALREKLEALMPTDITQIGDDDFSDTLAKCFGLVASKAKAQSSDGLDFVPLLITSYADGQRMLTITCGVSDPKRPDAFPNKQFKNWEFASKDWTDIHDIALPVLSAKERFKLDGNLRKTAKRMLAALTFLPTEDEPTSLQAVLSYKKFQRFYPAFRYVED